MNKRQRRGKTLEEAWIGDAVLTLYARLKILKEDGAQDAAKCSRMTSNHFLNSLGEPSEVEAEIGRVYLQAGLDPAFQFVEQRLMPLFHKQEQNRRKRDAKP